MAYVATILGATLMAFLVQTPIYKLLKRRFSSEVSTIVSGVTFALIYIIIGAYGKADGGPPNFVWSSSIGIPAAILTSLIIWFGAWRSSKGANKPNILKVVGMNKKLSAIIVLAVSLLSFFGAKHFVNTYLGNNLEDALLLVAEDLNKTLPKEIDEITALVSVGASDNVLSYNYQILVSKEEFGGDEAVKRLNRHLKQTVCADEDMKSLMKEGVHYRYRYEFSSEANDFEFLIKNEVCTQSSSNAEWTKVSEIAGGTFYVDFGRMRKVDGYVYWWELLDLEKPAENGHLSNISYIQGDCKQFRNKDISFHWYKEPMGGGVGNEVTTSDKWKNPQPNTKGESILKSVCSR